jgi:hypothetical protein
MLSQIDHDILLRLSSIAAYDALFQKYFTIFGTTRLFGDFRFYLHQLYCGFMTITTGAAAGDYSPLA